MLIVNLLLSAKDFFVNALCRVVGIGFLLTATVGAAMAQAPGSTPAQLEQKKLSEKERGLIIDEIKAVKACAEKSVAILEDRISNAEIISKVVVLYCQNQETNRAIFAVWDEQKLSDRIKLTKDDDRTQRLQSAVLPVVLKARAELAGKNCR